MHCESCQKRLVISILVLVTCLSVCLLPAAYDALAYKPEILRFFPHGWNQPPAEPQYALRRTIRLPWLPGPKHRVVC